MSVPAAGWYPDSIDARMLRWWDGAAWTRHVQAVPVIAPTSAASGGPAAAAAAPDAPPANHDPDRVAARVAELLAARAAEREAERAAAAAAAAAATVARAAQEGLARASRPAVEVAQPERTRFEDLLSGGSPAPTLRADGTRGGHAQDTLGSFSSDPASTRAVLTQSASPEPAQTQSRAHGRRGRIASAGLVVAIVGLGGCGAYLFPLVAQASALHH